MPLDLTILQERVLRTVATPQVSAPTDSAPTESPQIDNLSGDVEIYAPRTQSISASARRLYTILARRRALFLRGGVVVELATYSSGRQRISVLTPPGARSRFEIGIRWMKSTRSGDMPTILPEDIAKAFLEANDRKLLPRLEGVLDCPILMSTGGELVLLKPGYNEEFGLLVIGSEVPSEVPLDEAKGAILQTILGEYEFATPADKARAVAALLTPALSLGKFLSGRAGICVIEADDSQTGKGYLVRLLAAIYGEVPTCFSKNKGGVGSFDESLDTALISGRPVISIENVRGPVNSEKLESFLTEPTYLARIPYQQGMEIEPSRFVLFLTSNGAELTQDLANRSLLIRIRKRRNHGFRQFEEGDLLSHVQARQRYFLGCVYSLVKHWHEVGRPKTNDNRHSMRSWTQSCDWIAQHLLGLPPILEGHLELIDRAALSYMGFLRQLAITVDRRNKLGTILRAHELFDLAMEHNLAVPCLKAGGELDNNQGARAVGMALGRAFRERDVVSIDEFQITRTETEPDEVVHHASRVYTFAKRDSSALTGQSPTPQVQP